MPIRLAHVSTLIRAKKHAAVDNSFVEEETAKEKKAKAKQEAKAKEIQKEKEAAAAAIKAEEQRKLEEEKEAKGRVKTNYGPTYRILPGAQFSDIEYERERSAKKKKLMPKTPFNIRTCVKGIDVPWPKTDEDYPEWLFTKVLQRFPVSNSYLHTPPITDLRSFKKHSKRARKLMIKAQNEHSRQVKGIRSRTQIPLNQYFMLPEKEEITDLEYQLLALEGMDPEEREEYIKESKRKAADLAAKKLKEKEKEMEMEVEVEAQKNKEKEKEKEKKKGKDTPKEKEKEAPAKADKDKGKGKK